MNIFTAPFVNALFGFYYLFGNLGWSIIAVTIIIRLVLMPLVWPSLKSAKKMQALQPQLKKLQDKYGKDKQGLAKAQMEMYKKEGVNPLSGCLPNILQIAVLMIFFSAFNMVSGFAEGKITRERVNEQLIQNFKASESFKFKDTFLGSNLSMTPAKALSGGINWGLILPLFLLLGSGLLQYWSAKKMMPNTKVDEAVVKKGTKDKEDDMMATMRTQSTYMMPLMTIFIGFNFSIGILLYWFVNSAVMAGQQMLMSKIDSK
jgi:YidC/Oxa1 family membrane protein insertase